MNADFKLDKNSEIPIHHQLYCYIKDCIENKEYLPGEKLPSENEMQEKFDVSRITVRRAISDLEHDGYLRKFHGKGTVVLARKNQRDISSLSSFSGDAKLKGVRQGSVILKFEKMPANVKVATALHLQINEPVFYLIRLRTLNGEILSLQHTYITSKLGFDLKREEFNESTSLYEYLENHAVVLASADETIETFPPTAEIRHQLFLDDSQWVFYKERITYDQKDLPVEYSENYYIADRFKYFVHISKLREA